MSWLDDFYRIVGKGDVRDSDFIRNGERAGSSDRCNT